MPLRTTMYALFRVELAVGEMFLPIEDHQWKIREPFPHQKMGHLNQPGLCCAQSHCRTTGIDEAKGKNVTTKNIFSLTESTK
jgi:hypothetical protein